MVFGINSTRNADRKVNSTRLRLVLFCTFLSALLVLLIPNTTEKHAITYTNTPKLCDMILLYIMITEGDASASSCYSTAAVGGGVVGGFVGGVLMTAVVAAVIFVVFAQRMRSVHTRVFVAHYYWSCFS